MKNLDEQVKRIFNSPDYSSWEIVKFGDIAAEVKQTLTDSELNDVQYVIGLEHLSSLDIHIRSWNNSSKEHTFRRKFTHGQVLFGRRRAYQRKAVLAEFDGVCSGDIIVLEANKEKIVPFLLPLLVHSDKFYKWAVATSAGSLSPRTKYKSLAELELRIPSLPLQEKIASLFKVLDSSIETKLDALKKLETAYAVQLHKIFKDEDKSAQPLRNYIKEYRNGFAEGKRDLNGIFQIRMNNITRQGNLDFNESAFVPKRKGYENFLLRNKDILFNNTNSPDLVGKNALWDNQDMDAVFSNHFTRIRTDENLLLPKYLHLWLTWNFAEGEFKRRCVRWVNQASVKSDDLLSMQIPVPSTEIQLLRLKEFEQLEILSNQLQSSVERTRALLFSLNNNIYGI